jgi:hypothetical protein
LDNNAKRETLAHSNPTPFQRVISPFASRRTDSMNGLLGHFFKGTIALGDAELQYESATKLIKEGSEKPAEVLVMLDSAWRAYAEAAINFSKAGEAQMAEYSNRKHVEAQKLHDSYREQYRSELKKSG